jgi:hypothetical protein
MPASGCTINFIIRASSVPNPVGTGLEALSA